METLEELIKRIEDNLEEDWVKLKEIPKRCILNLDYYVENVPGYLVTLYYTKSEGKEFLFISDIEDKSNFHYAPSLFKTKYFKDRCSWISIDDVEIEEYHDFYI